MHNQHTKGYLALAFAIIIFTGQGLSLKAIMSTPDSYSGLQLSFLRQALAVVVMAPFLSMLAWRNRHALWDNRVFVIKGAVIGYLLHSMLTTIGLQYTTALNSYILFGLLPIFALILGALFYNRRISMNILFYIILSIIGVLIIVTKGHLETLRTLQVNIGDILLLIACIIWAYYGFLMRSKSPHVHYIAFVFVGMFISSVGGGIVVYLAGETDLIKDIWTPRFMGLMFYTVVLAQTLSLFAYTYATTVLDAIIPAISINLIPPMGAILSVILLGEELHDYHAVGIVLIGISVYKIVADDIKRKQQQNPSEQERAKQS